ncbi:MAG: hypothetical protein EXS10_07285 [Phycisphaerales bacterium]|nr:hypothetical protein [Phycisphaerales bacterium]
MDTRFVERDDQSVLCPFGGGVCGVGTLCAIHDRLVWMQASVRKLPTETTFETFRVAVQEGGLKPVAKGVRAATARES